MSDNPKTPLDHVNDTLSQLKEMRHYSGNNVETLTAEWLLFDGELSKLEQTAKIDDLMTRQGELHAALDSGIAAFEEMAMKMQRPSEEEAGRGGQGGANVGSADTERERGNRR